MLHKNNGLVSCMYVMLWTSHYDINNLQVIASNMRGGLLSNIANIHK